MTSAVLVAYGCAMCAIGLGFSVVGWRAREDGITLFGAVLTAAGALMVAAVAAYEFGRWF